MAERKVTCETYTDRGIVGPRGKSAYEQAVDGGYTGTEEQFEELLASDLNTIVDSVTDINTVADNISDVNSVGQNISSVNTVADVTTDVSTVAGISSDVTQVAGIASAVSTVSNHDSEVTLVADNMASVMTTASNIGDVSTVAGISTDVSTVAGNNSNVTAVAGNATNINTVANNISNVNTVASNISDVNTVATNISDISNVNDNLTIIQDVSENMDDVIAAADAVEEVLPHITEINNVSDNISDVVTVAGINADVSAVASNSSNINTVSGNNTNITTVATNISNINAVASDLTNIDNASTYATNAATSATNAQKWAEGTDAQVQPLGGTKSAKGWAQRAQEIVDTLGAVMHYKGSVATFEDLPTTGQELGDVWNILSDGSNYAWDGNDWDAVGGAVDMSAYRTAAEQDIVDATKQDKLTAIDAGVDMEIVEAQQSETEKTVSGTDSLSLTDAKENSLTSVKLFGGCEQSGTPTPTTPQDIVSNNGVLKYSANMANVNEQTALIGYYISAQGVVTSDMYNWIYQSFIPVKPSTTYTLSMSSSVYYVSISEYSTADNSGFIVRKVGNTGTNTTLTITTGANTNFVRFGTNLDRTEVTLEEVLAINWMLNEGGTAIPYAPYAEGGIYTDGTIETVELTGKNLFDKNTALLGDISTSGSYTSRTYRVVSDYIPVIFGQTFVGSGTLRDTDGVDYSAQVIKAFYKADKSYIAGSRGSVTGAFTINDNECAYIRIVFFNQSLVAGKTVSMENSVLQLELGSSATPYAPYYNGGTATAERLLAVGDYQDEQEVIAGSVIRNVGIKVLDGTESWAASKAYSNVYTASIAGGKPSGGIAPICNYFAGYDSYVSMTANDYGILGASTATISIKNKDCADVTAFTTWLAAQYAAGTPVIVIYPLATSTAETVTPQLLQTQAGTNILQITQASISGLSLEATYTEHIDIQFKINFKNNTGYTTNKGTVTSVNNTLPDSNGNVNLDTLPSQTGQSGKFLTTDGTYASWATVDALPSQTGNSGKFLTTNGTTASWGNAIENKATGTNAVSIIGSATSKSGAVNIGNTSSAGTAYNVAIGQNASASGNNVSASPAYGASTAAYGYYASASAGTALGSMTTSTNGVAIGRGYSTAKKVVANGNGSIAIGFITSSGDNCSATAAGAIQIGNGQNSTANTVQFNSYQMLDASGKIPSARIPDLSATYVNQTDLQNAVNSVKRNVGEIVESTVPLTDAGLHLLDGSLLSGSGSYADFVTHMAGVYADHPELFTTEADWQTSVTNYGVCGKFVYDSVNNTVRLPKKSSTERHLVKSTVSGTDWCDVYSDGWCEQGGEISNSGTNTQQITFSKAFVDTNYYFNRCNESTVTGTATSFAAEAYTNKQTTGIKVYCYSSITKCIWQAKGYIDVSDLEQETIYPYIVIANSTKTQIEVDIDEIATDLNGKADVDFSNITANAKKVVFNRAFTPANLTIAKGNASIAGTYTLTDLPDDGVVRLVLLNCRLILGANNRSSMAIQTDVMSNYIIVAETNNSFTASGAVLVPMIRQVTLSFPQIAGGVMADTEFMFRGYI